MEGEIQPITHAASVCYMGFASVMKYAVILVGVVSDLNKCKTVDTAVG